MTRDTELCLLAVLGTPTPDVYANAIACSYIALRVRRVVLVYIEGDAAKLEREDARRLATGIWKRIDELEREESDRVSGGRNLYAELNRDILNRAVECARIDHVVGDLQAVCSRFPSAGTIIDVTGATKVSSVDVVAAAALLRVPAYSFELKKAGFQKPTTERTYTRLAKEDYDYSDLLLRPGVANVLTRIRRSVATLWVLVGSSVITAACLALLLAGQISSNLLSTVGLLSSIATIGTAIVSASSKR